MRKIQDQVNFKRFIHQRRQNNSKRWVKLSSKVILKVMEAEGQGQIVKLPNFKATIYQV